MGQKKYKQNVLGLIPVVLATVLIYGLYVSCMRSFEGRLGQIDEDISQNRTVVLSSHTDSLLLRETIFNNGYCETERDAAFITKTLIDRQQKDRLLSLFSLQKRDFGQVRASQADSCHVLKTILSVSRDKIGVANDSVFIYDSSAYSGSNSIIVLVERELKKNSRLQMRTRKIKCENVPVRLELHYRDSLGEAQVQTLGYLNTDHDGKVVFNGLNKDYSYSVLPVNEGFEYGRSQGVVGGEWIAHENWVKRMAHRMYNFLNGRHDNEFKFIEKEHRIPLFTNTALRQIKNERSIIVRTPEEFKQELVKSKWCLLVSWWVLCLVMAIPFKRFPNLPKREFDFWSGLILACLMFLSGLSVLMMFSMADPVNDELRGWDMTKGIIGGVLVAIVLQFYDVSKRFNYEMFPFRAYAGLKKRHLRGLGWLVMALVLTVMLFVPGIGRSVGGMKVNLALGPLVFQPSEIAKYLIVLFFSIFFAENIKRIIHYSDAYDTNFGKKIKVMGLMLLGLACLMFLYVVLGDMGPGLVLGITFVLLYSFYKSKQDLRVEGMARWRNALRCDFMMLIYGVALYALILYAFHLLDIAYWYIIGSVVWLVLWIVIGLFSIQKAQVVFTKQVHETAIIMNLVIFIFILGSNAGKDSGVLKRLEDRTNMCTNTWGGMDKVFHEIKNDTLASNTLSDPVSNTQVANSLWALASGGLYGQGWGNGKPSVVPAFHTDMILSSIGEQIGWVGLLLVLLAYLVMLGTVGWKGLQTGEEFPMFFCMGVATVTAVQLFIIALGSAGVIPLTGVTVPLLSYGKVSMILNIAAFGMVLSLVTRKDCETQTTATANVDRKNAEAYMRPYCIVGACFIVGVLFTLSVWAKYQILQRNKTMLQPAFVINTQGNPVLEYNPRIGLITKEMYAGRIFDRKGLLLATSNKDDIVVDSLSEYLNREQLEVMRRRHLKRYYPFGEHLFFMVGDQNSGLLYSFDENCPVGYLAEAQHLSYLRGFDNVLYDKNRIPAKVHLVTDKKHVDGYLRPEVDTTDLVVLRDYSALLPYLKDGSGKKMAKRNENVEQGTYDLHLTVDAVLQKDIQESLARYMHDNHRNNKHYNLMRVSVVVLDAENGDLLASANYPLPDYDRLKAEEGTPYYTDNNKGDDWMAYTDRDLGTTFQTAPGSTAKVMSAIAGLRDNIDNSNQTYFVSYANRIEVPGDPVDIVTMRRAIVESSNCYFVNLVNDKNLYKELEMVYSTMGIGLGQITPYYYRVKSDTSWKTDFEKKIDDNERAALEKYRLFTRGELKDPKDGKIKGRDNTNMSIGEWKWAWGQGYEGFEILASPLNMARVASTVVNDGKMPITQYIMGDVNNGNALRNEGSLQVLDSLEASILRGYMLAEADNQYIRQRKRVRLPSYVGGKTGTPERGRISGTVSKYNRKTNEYRIKPNVVKLNDGWYMFFSEGWREGDVSHHPIAVVVRMERGVGSGPAVRLSGNMLLGVLHEHNYIR